MINETAISTHGRYIVTTPRLQDMVTLKIGFHKNQTNNFHTELAVQNINNQITKSFLPLKLVLIHVVD